MSKCQIVQKSKCPNVKSSKSQNVQMSNRLNVKSSKSLNVKMSNRPKVQSSKINIVCQNTEYFRKNSYLCAKFK